MIGCSRVPAPPARMMPFMVQLRSSSRAAGVGEHAQAFAGIDLVAQRPPPPFVVEVPANGLFDAGVEILLRPPAELLLELGRVDGVAEVVARPVGTKVISSAWPRPAGRSRSRMAQIVRTTSMLRRSLRPPTLYFSPMRPRADDDVERPGVILDIEPVADVGPRPVDRQRLAVDGVEDDQRDQLLGEVIRAVIVGAVRDDRRESVGVRPSRDEVVGRRLGRGIGRTRIVRRGLDEQPVVAERAIHLVGRDVQEAEPFALLAGEAQPIGARGLEHREGAEDVGLDERVAAGDRAVDMALGGEVDDVVRLEGLERVRDRRPVADVDPGEAVVGRVVDGRQRGEIAGVGEGVDVEDVDAGADQVAANRGADETRPARHQHVSHGFVLRIRGSAARSRRPANARQCGRAIP